MTLLSHSEVRSEHLMRRTPAAPIPVDAPLIAPNLVLSYFNARNVDVTRMELRHVGDSLVYDIAAADGARALIDAVSGQALSPISRDLAIAVALQDRESPKPPDAAVLLDAPEDDYLGDVPVWRVDFDDADGARLYISPTTAQIVERTNTVWRIHDFVWMLHIMDYAERRDYNHLLIRVVAAAGLFLALSGAALAVLAISRRRTPAS